jgi:8-oxo-dGTP pyrophosphatase MutT (NUDIX family)
MYKVFKENTTFILAKSENLISIDQAVTICIEKPSSVIEIITNLGNNNDESIYVLYCSKLKKTIEVLENNFPIKVAAGGWAFNNADSLLMIKRYGFWDLPKGHLEKGESLEECAIREVEEETGVKNLNIESKIGISRHLIKKKNGYNLKLNHWYLMSTNYDGKLSPQKDEDITKAKWVEANAIEKHIDKAWLSLKNFYYDYVIDSKLNLKD